MATAALPLGSTVRADRRFLLWLGAAVLLLIVVVSLVAPGTAENDPRPSTYNAAPGGAKAAFLMLESMGRPVARWTEPLDALGDVDAMHTTLVLAAPTYSALERDRLGAALKGFLMRGGRVLTTGAGGALLLPEGAVSGSVRFNALCYTKPEGPGPLARTGKVEMNDPVRWGKEGPGVYVEQRCGPDAVVVRLQVGHGEAVWWSSPSPLSNAELHNTADLRLLLASLGEGRRVLFDESLQQEVRSQWTAARGLPLWWILAQAALIFGLLVFSFSRRRGPVRLPVGVPRSSPVEFAVSMGDLYERAGATGAATEAARRQLLRTLVHSAGLGQHVVQEGPQAIVSALHKSFGGQWKSVGDHLTEAAAVADTALKAGSALQLVQALYRDIERIQQAVQPAAERGGDVGLVHTQAAEIEG